MKFATYNIQSSIGLDNQHSIERIAGVLRSLQADFIAINEILVNCQWTGFTDQPERLSQLLGMRNFFGETMQFDDRYWAAQKGALGHYGIAFLTPHPVYDIHRFPLPGTPEMEPRIAVSVRVEAPQPFFAIVTHFCWEPEYEAWRVASARRIREELEALHRKHPEMPTVLLGDLNSTPESAPIEELRKDWQIANEGHFALTHPADNPTQTLDYIMLSKGQGEFLKVEVIEEKVASDHRPLTAEIRFSESEKTR